MRKVMHQYEKIIISKILFCKTPFDVLAIIDKKVNLLQKGSNDKTILRSFIDDCLSDLREVKEKHAAPTDLSKIRAAIDHLRNLEQHYKIH
jgi:hypothetical protein